MREKLGREREKKRWHGFSISIYKNVVTKQVQFVCGANQKIGSTSYLGLLALSQLGNKLAPTTIKTSITML